VVVRSGPVTTAVTGTVVARHGDEDDVRAAWRGGHQLGRWVRPVQVDTSLVGKGPKGLAAAPERTFARYAWRRLFP